MRKLQLLVVLPGVWLVRLRSRYLAGLYFEAVSPLVTWLQSPSP